MTFVLSTTIQREPRLSFQRAGGTISGTKSGQHKIVLKTAFGQWLKQRRKTLDLTQDELARRIGCSTVTIRKFESGQRRPSRQVAKLLAEHLNVRTENHLAFMQFARTGQSDYAAAFTALVRVMPPRPRY